MLEIRGRKGRDIYYYDEETLFVTDKEGNRIKLYESLNELSDSNKSLIIDDLFHSLYEVQNRCKDFCETTKKYKLEWS